MSMTGRLVSWADVAACTESGLGSALGLRDRAYISVDYSLSLVSFFLVCQLC